MNQNIETSIKESKIIILPEISNRITALRYLLAVLVVFIHNNLNADRAINYYHLDFVEPVIITWIKMFICSILGGASVPLFFLFAAYLQFKKQDSYPKLLKKKVNSLFVPYVIWTLIGVFLFFIAQSIPFLAPFFQNENNIVRNWNVIDWINLFWVHINKYPLVYQFWFIRNLIVMVLLSPLLSFIAKKTPVAVIITVIILYLNGLPLGFSTALFFYMCGYFFAEYDINFFSLADKVKWIELTILIILEMVILIKFEGQIKLNGVSTIISCLFFLKLSAKIIASKTIFSVAKNLAGFSFFLYAIHAPFIIDSLNKISYRLIPLHGIGCLIQFIIPTVITIVLGTAIGFALKKICLPLFIILNGGRK